MSLLFLIHEHIYVLYGNTLFIGNTTNFGYEIEICTTLKEELLKKFGTLQLEIEQELAKYDKGQS